MIARTETHTDRERILALLSPRSTDACVRQVFADIDEINRLMEYYSFRTPQLADRFADLLESRYRYEIFAIYGPSLLLRKSSDPHRCQKHQRDKKPFHNSLLIKQCARIGALHVHQYTTICLLFLNQIDLEIIEIEYGVDARNSECDVAILEDITRLSAVLEGKLE